MKILDIKFRFILVFGLAILISGDMLAAGANIQAMAAYKGKDRQEKLVAAAKKEGTVTLYTSITQDIAQKLTEGFEAKYGVKVKLWRSGDSNVLQRVLTERNAGRQEVDVINIGSIEMEMAHREKVLLPLRSPYADNLVPGSVGTNHEYVATFINLLLQTYNTNSVKEEDLPKTYQDLLDPKWKGKLGIESTDQEWFYTLVMSMGEEKGFKYFRDLMAINKPTIRTGHSLLGNLVSSGEVPLGLDVYNHTAVSAKKKGAPVNYILLEPAIGVSFSIGLSNRAQHPNAALLFYEYMLTDGQKIFADLDYTPTNKDIDTPFKNTHYLLADKPRFVDQGNRWRTLFNDIIVKQK